MLPFARAGRAAAPDGDARQRRRDHGARVRAATSRDTRIDAVEIDAELSDIGRRCSACATGRGCASTPRTRARSCARPDERYDLIFVDAYRQPYIPFYLATRSSSSWRATASTPGGVVMINVGHPEGEDDSRRC